MEVFRDSTENKCSYKLQLRYLTYMFPVFCNTKKKQPQIRQYMKWKCCGCISNLRTQHSWIHKISHTTLQKYKDTVQPFKRHLTLIYGSFENIKITFNQNIYEREYTLFVHICKLLHRSSFHITCIIINL